MFKKKKEIASLKESLKKKETELDQMYKNFEILLLDTKNLVGVLEGMTNLQGEILSNQKKTRKEVEDLKELLENKVLATKKEEEEDEYEAYQEYKEVTRRLEIEPEEVLTEEEVKSRKIKIGYTEEDITKYKEEVSKTSVNEVCGKYGLSKIHLTRTLKKLETRGEREIEYANY